jgi:electron transfer flavoprotein alpha subunit
VAGRAAARLVAGLTGDAIGLEVSSGRLLAWKPAFGGCLVAAITASSPIQMATVRPGALLGWSLRPPEQIPVHTSITPRTTRVVVSEVSPNDNVEALGRARVVVGVGSGVNPDDCHLLTPLLKLLDAELAATRRVTDRGWLPHSRQVGLTGRSVAPALYFAIGLSGRYNHMVGTRRAGCVIAINIDSQAPVSAFADLTMVADWREAVPALTDSLRSQIGQQRVNS